jgi:hypothetical protein
MRRDLITGRAELCLLRSSNGNPATEKGEKVSKSRKRTALAHSEGPPDIESIKLPKGLRWDMLPTLPLAYKSPRRLITRSGARVRGANFHPRFGSCQWESGIERNFYALLTVTLSVILAFSQPLVLRLDAGEYTPDALIFLADGSRIWIECKYEKDLDPETVIKLGQAAATFASVGDRFIVAKDRHLADDLPEVVNAHLFGNWYSSAPDHFAEPLEAGTYAALSARHGRQTVNRAIARGELTLDFSSEVNDASNIWPTQGGTGYEPSFLHA